MFDETGRKWKRSCMAAACRSWSVSHASEGVLAYPHSLLLNKYRSFVSFIRGYCGDMHVAIIVSGAIHTN
jgi:hypothetical protein